MNFSQQLKESIADLHLLNHPFYQEWTQGTLTIETLSEYASQYYKHVEAFPRYISAAHSNCQDLSSRQVLLENLADEEGLNGVDHPELWLRFMDGLGCKRQDVETTEKRKSIDNVIKTFLSAGRASYAEGLASLYAYEYQVPEVAESKIEGLKKYYHMADERSLSFFTVHQEADVFHRKACETLLDKLPEEEHAPALSAARKSAQSLWDFLSDIHASEHAA